MIVRVTSGYFLQDLIQLDCPSNRNLVFLLRSVSMYRRKIRNFDDSLFHLLCIFYQFSCVACRMPCVGNQEVRMIDHIPICSDNSKLTGHILHSGWIVSVVKTLCFFDRPFSGVVRYEQGQRDLRMQLLCCDDCLCRKIVKVSVMTNNELCHIITLDVLVDCLL